MSGLFRVGGDEYDNFMGRYSTVLAPLFADFAGVSSGDRVLDVGAGTGALTAELLTRGASVAASDPSPEFVSVLRERFPDLEVEEAPAEVVSRTATGVFDVALAQLVVAFMSDAPACGRGDGAGGPARCGLHVGRRGEGVFERDGFRRPRRSALLAGGRAAPLPDDAGDP